MSGHDHIRTLAKEADTLAEFIERADVDDVSIERREAGLIREIWDRDVPEKRAVEILQRERERLDAYERISLSESSRAPRYTDLNDLALLSGYEFEHVLAEVLGRVEGEATVTEASGDQGLDVVWFRDDETVGIQAKAYGKDNPVGNSAVQEIYTGSVVRASEYAIDVPAVVTTSRYTPSAREAAENSNVVLYGRRDLSQWLSEAELDAEEMGEVLDRV